jgi:hypothetical protein
MDKWKQEKSVATQRRMAHPLPTPQRVGHPNHLRLWLNQNSVRHPPAQVQANSIK